MEGQSIYIKIAGISVRIATVDSIEIFPSDPVYASFIKASCEGQGVDAELGVDLKGLPDLSDISAVCDTDDWNIYTRGREYFAIKKPYTSDIEPQWVLKLCNDFSRGTLYCKPAIADAAKKTGRLENPLSYPLDNTLMMYLLSRKGGAIVHSAGIEIDGRAYIFPGNSGSGKTTISRQFVTHSEIICLSDDRMIARKEGAMHTAYGTPWPSDEKIAVNRGAPLAGIVFLSKAAENSIKRITAGAALQRLISTVSIPWYDRQTSDLVLSFCDGLLSSVPAYELSFKPTPEVADFFVDFVRNKA